MLKKRLIVFLLLMLSLISCKGVAQKTETEKPTVNVDTSKTEKSIFPKAIGRINDYGKVFTDSQRTELTKVLYDYEVETTRQIAIITIDSIKPYNDVHKYATDLANAWGVGTAEKNNGLTIVVCNPCRQIGIATGIGTQRVLTDQICEEILVKSIVPEFKNGNFYKGIKKGVTELINKWK